MLAGFASAVELTGLQSAAGAALNGRRGLVEANDAAADRWVVLLDGPATGEVWYQTNTTTSL